MDLHATMTQLCRSSIIAGTFRMWRNWQHLGPGRTCHYNLSNPCGKELMSVYVLWLYLIFRPALRHRDYSLVAVVSFLGV